MSPGARRPAGKARRGRLLGIFDRGATPSGGMPRPGVMLRITVTGHHDGVNYSEALSSAFWRYTAFQIPGWLIAAGGGVFLYRTMDVPVWVASGVLVVWVIKDYALYPLLRRAYELDERRPIERLIGEQGTASDELAPTGYIRVRGELWRARFTDDRQRLEAGSLVEVIAIEGTTLVVTRKRGLHR